MGTNQDSGGGEPAVKYGVAFGQVYRDELDCVRHRWQTVYTEDQYDLGDDGKPDGGGEPAKSGKAGDAAGDSKRKAKDAAGDSEKKAGNAEADDGKRRLRCDEPSTDNQLVGLAFSGGGIRSATINMGIAQALERRGVFDHVDYMSTVSGGGYLGSSISTAMRKFGPDEDHGQPCKACKTALDDQGEFPYEYQEPEEQDKIGLTGAPPMVETKFLTWVRNNSNYMATGNFLAWPRIFAVVLRGMLANFLVLLPLILGLAVAMVWIHGNTLAEWEAGDQRLAAIREAATEAEEAAELAEKRAIGSDQEAWAAAARARQEAEAAAEKVETATAAAPKLSGLFPAALVIVGILILLILAFPAFIRVYKAYKHRDVVECGEESSVASRGLLESVFAVVLVAAVVVALLEALPLLIRWFHRIESGGLRDIYAGATSGGALAVIAAAGKALSSLGGLKQKIALFVVGLLGLAIPLVVALYVADDLVYPVALIEAGEPTPAYLVTSHPPLQFFKLSSDLGPVRILPGILLMFITGGLAASRVGKLRKSSGRTVLTVLAALAGILAGYLLLVLGSMGLAKLSVFLGVPGIRPDLLILGMTVILMAYCYGAVDVNLNAVLGLYRDRLAAAYLIGKRKKEDENGNPTDEEEIFVEPDLNLEDLCGGIRPEEKDHFPGERPPDARHAPCHPSKAPYYIVNTALNLQGSKDEMLRDRGSDFFMFSKLYYGGRRTGYCETWRLEKVFPQMDLPTAMAISAAAASPNSGRMTSKPLVALMTLLNVRLGYWVPHPGKLYDWLKEKKIAEPNLGHRWRWRVPPISLLREMASAVNEEHDLVNLSDGGHIENMAAYELLRRRCKYIICGDGEADAKLTFGGLATLMRSARIDMGIEIEILLDDLRLGEDGNSHQHAALGKIKYPPRTVGGDPEVGFLLYVKSSFTGNEDETMREYRAKKKDFPHESTADQFFDEGQFEAYRALGFHMADGLFAPRQRGEGKMDWKAFVKWFDDLSADLAPRLSAKHADLQEQLRLIQETLVQKEYRDYFYELNPELPRQTAAAEQSDPPPLTPEVTYVVGRQLALMENAFVTLDLGQPVNWEHEANQGWRQLFEGWSRAPRFRQAYKHLGRLHSGRFQNFCSRVFPGLPDAADLSRAMRKEEAGRGAAAAGA